MSEYKIKKLEKIVKELKKCYPVVADYSGKTPKIRLYCSKVENGQIYYDIPVNTSGFVPVSDVIDLIRLVYSDCQTSLDKSSGGF